MKGSVHRTGLISLGSAVRIRLSLPKKRYYMKNLTMYCLTLEPSHEEKIINLNYIPVGLGTKKFSNNFFSDKNKINISEKNSFYGEYTFHYWIWKNYLEKISTEWVGFCQYRKFFINEKIDEKKISFDELKKVSIDKIENYNINYDCILGRQFSVENYKSMKIIKNHFFKFLLNPSVLFFKKKRTIKFHFDLFHGNGNLDRAINLLDEDNKEDFRKFVNSRTSFNPHNMFICKTKLLNNYYETVFPWLKKCEEIFGYKKLKGYGMQRIYGFLAERFLSYWFLKNYKVKELPIIVKDLSDYRPL